MYSSGEREEGTCSSSSSRLLGLGDPEEDPGVESLREETCLGQLGVRKREWEEGREREDGRELRPSKEGRKGRDEPNGDGRTTSVTLLVEFGESRIRFPGLDGNEERKESRAKESGLVETASLPPSVPSPRAR